MKRFLILAALLGITASGSSAFAADLPQPMPPPQAPATYIPAVVPVYNWGGIYFGVNGGYGFGKSQWTIPGVGTSPDFSTSGALVGGTLGANFQTGAFVFGIEGDFDGSWIQGTSDDAVCVMATIAGCETKNTWLGTFRARVGYAADRMLFYGTAGGAFGNVEQGVSGAATSTSPANLRPDGRRVRASRPRSPITGQLGSNICSSICRMRHSAAVRLLRYRLMPI